MIQRIEAPADPRMEPLIQLRKLMPLPVPGPDAKANRQLLHRVDLRDRVRK